MRQTVELVPSQQSLKSTFDIFARALTAKAISDSLPRTSLCGLLAIVEKRSCFTRKSLFSLPESMTLTCKLRKKPST